MVGCRSRRHNRPPEEKSEGKGKKEGDIGVGAQSTLGGTTFLPEKYV